MRSKGPGSKRSARDLDALPSGKKHVRRKARHDRRRKAHDETMKRLSLSQARGYRAPGSMNRKKIGG